MYKVIRHGAQVIVADRWYLGSRKCSSYCHVLETLTRRSENGLVQAVALPITMVSTQPSS